MAVRKRWAGQVAGGEATRSPLGRGEPVRPAEAGQCDDPGQDAVGSTSLLTHLDLKA